MKALDEELRPLVDASAARIGDPGPLRERARRRRSRRRIGLAATLVAVAAVASVPFLIRDEGDDPSLRVTTPDSTPRQIGDEIRIAFEAVPEGATGYHIDLHRFFVVRDGERVRAFVDDAQHLPGERLWWCPREKQFAAPTHGETFASDGTKVAGPAQRDLDQYNTSVEDGDLVINLAQVIRGAPSTASSTPPGEDSRFTTPWNRGPSSYCQGALTTDGVAPVRLPSRVSVFTAGPEQLVTTNDHGVHLIDAQTGRELALLDDRAAHSPAVASDGTVWYTVGGSNEPSSIWRLDPTDDAPAQMIARGFAPAISPDARFLAYVTGADESEGNILVVRDLSDGSERRWTGLPARDNTPPSAGWISYLAWHPDGTHIAFGFSYGFEHTQHEIDVVALTSDKTLADAEALPGRLIAPAWTPGGVLLAIEPEATVDGGARIVRFEDLNAAPTSDERFRGLNLYNIDLSADGEHLLARSGSDVFVAESDAVLRRVAGPASGASW
jgi:hypothetical protein